MGYPGEGPAGDRTETWDASLQTATRRIACCRCCNTPFELNQPRVSPHSGVAGKYFHPHCIAAGLGPVRGVYGYTQLPPEAGEVIDQCVDRPGATREDYLEAKRRRVGSNGPGPNGPAAPPTAEGTVDPQMDPIDVDGVFEDSILHHMDWWDTVDYGSARQDCAPTVGSVPETMLMAVADARTAVLIRAQTTTGIERDRLLKLLFFLDRLLFAQPADSGHQLSEWSEGERPSLDRVISARLHRFWRGGWDSLWREAHVFGGAAPAGQQSTSKATRSSAEVRRIEKLLLAREESRAASCVMKASKMAGGTGVAESLRLLFPRSTATTAVPLTPETLNDEAIVDFRDKLAKAVQTQICRHPRLSSPGPSGARFEHWGTLRYNGVGLEAAGHVLTSIALGEASQDAMEAFLGGRLIALSKKDGGVRPIACGSVLRRIVAKAACRVLKTDLCRAAGKQQFGVGRAAGTEKVHKALSTLAQQRPEAAVLSFDAANAFNTMSRNEIRKSLAEHVPLLSRVLGPWYAMTTRHAFWDEEGLAWEVRAERGVDRGGPLNTATFAITLPSRIDQLERALQTVDPCARVLAYLDDIDIAIDATHAPAAVEATRVMMGTLGMAMHEGKTKVWTLRPGAPVPESLAHLRCDRLTCLGSTLTFLDGSGDEDEVSWQAARVAVLADSPGNAPAQALGEYIGRLKELQAAGLTAQFAFVLLRTYVNGAVVHLQRGSHTSEIWCHAFDIT